MKNERGGVCAAMYASTYWGEREHVIWAREGEREVWYRVLDIYTYVNHEHSSEQEQSLEEHGYTEEFTEHSHCCGHEETLQTMVVCVGGVACEGGGVMDKIEPPAELSPGIYMP